MSKFNESSEKFRVPPKSRFNESSERFNKTPVADTKNNEGAPAFKMEDKIRFASRLLTSMFNEEKFYGDTSKALVEDGKKLMDAGQSKFVANAAIFAREEFHLRSAPHVISAEMAHHLKGRKWARKTIAKVCQRVDDMTEIFSYFISKFKKPIANSLKKGIGDAWVKFDEYQLDKYNYKRSFHCKKCGTEVTIKIGPRGGKTAFCPKCHRNVIDIEVKHPYELKDIALMCGVGERCNTPAQKALLGRLLNNELKTAQTWQTKMSAAKGGWAEKQEGWEELINKNKLGYMAALRNLRNIIQANVRNVDKVYKLLADEEQVLKSKQLPFRFSTAYRELKKAGIYNPAVYTAIETAIRHSCKNLPNLYGKTLIAADISGSMTQRALSENSDVKPADVAVLLMAIANYICEEAITATFSTVMNLYPLSGTNGIIANANSVRVTGGGTDVGAPIRYALNNRLFVDRFIILSDNEINDNTMEALTFQSRMGKGFTAQCQALLDEYRRRVNPNVWVHAIDMQGYGTQQFKGDKVNIICGWSEKVMEFIYTAESGIGGIVDKIENYYFK